MTCITGRRIIQLLEAEKPWWKPGTKLGYHTLTYGYLLGEIVRRVTGMTLGQFLQTEITAPLGIDFFIGLPEAEEPRAAEIIPERAEVYAPATGPGSSSCSRPP